MSRARVYLDYAASAPIRPEVTKALRKAEPVFGNPSSTHSFGREALNIIDEARNQIASILNCQPAEVMFTSGGTEADNLAIKGTAERYDRGHIITSMIEHAAVLQSCNALEGKGYSVTYLNPTEDGVVTAKQVASALRDDTILVSIMYVNNETGVTQPISEIAQVVQKHNADKQGRAVFHTDAVQAGSLLPLDVQKLGVDMLTLSGHKLGGQKGTGCLFVKSGVSLEPQIDGGGQQKGIRSGTINTTGVVGLATALSVGQKNRVRENARLGRLQSRLVAKLRQLPGITFNGTEQYRIPSIVNISILGKTSDELVIGLDLMGIAVSAASACASGSIEPSYVLRAMGRSEEMSRSSLRISIGYRSTARDIDRFVNTLAKLLPQ